MELDIHQAFSGLKIYLFGISIGIKSLIKGKIIIGLKRILLPISYWRQPVFTFILSGLNEILNENKIRILDIGSPKLLALYFAAKHNVEIYATDIQDESIWTVWQVYFDCLNHQKLKGKYITEYQDGRKLSYQDQSFDFVYSISVLEHIPDDGDSVTMREISRVLKTRGIAIIEVPYSNKSYDTFVKKDVYERKYQDKLVFYQRHYNDETIYDRLIKPSQLKLLRTIIIGERLPFEQWWNKVPYFCKILFSWIEAIVSNINHFKMTKAKIIEDMAHNRKRAMSIILVFQKKTFN